jgi:hypothetical protein
MRVLIAVSAAAAIAVAGCGGSSSGGFPTFPGGAVPSIGNGGNAENGGGGGGGGGNSLTSGLAANLAKLDSYKFKETMSGSSFGAGASADNGGATISGTVINKPDHRMLVIFEGTQSITVGDHSWMSPDGTSWIDTGSTSTSFAGLLPDQLYSTYFDAFASDYQAAGNGTQNGVACIHYKGNSTLNGLYSALAGVNASFSTDLWIAQDGGYPVKAVLAISGSSGGQGGSFGYSLDITDVNSASNKVEAPSVQPGSSDGADASDSGN